MTFVLAGMIGLTGIQSEQQSSVKIQLENIEKESSLLATESATQFRCLRRDLMKAIQENLARSAPDAGCRAVVETRKAKSLGDIRSSLSKIASMAESLPRENQVLRRLYFDSVYSREDMISDAESKTFTWIVEEGEGDDAPKRICDAAETFATGNSDAFEDDHSMKQKVMTVAVVHDPYRRR